MINKLLDNSIAVMMMVMIILLFPLHCGADSNHSESNYEQAPKPAIAIEVFVREGCPHCTKAKEFLAQLAHERPNLALSIRDVSQDHEAFERLRALAQAYGLTKLSVPTFLINGQLIVGFAEEAGTARQILDELDHINPSGQYAITDSSSCTPPDKSGCQNTNAKPEQFEISIFNRTFSLAQIGLPMFTLAMGLLDGFNPCSMWVLILMISLLAPMQNRWRMFAVAGTFIAVEGFAYFVFMTAWLNLFLWIGLSRASEVIIALIALLAGLINIKDFLGLSHGVSLSIPEPAKLGIYARIRAILQANNLRGALIGAVILAILVQIVEFLCTSGFPALYTRILTMNQLGGFSYYGYLLLYNIAYMVDDIIVLGIGIITLSQRRLQKNEGRWLKLISGAVMVGLAVFLLVK